MIQLRRIHIDPYRGIRGAADTDLPHTLNLRQLLLHDGGGGVIHGFFVVLIRGQAKDHDGRVRRIDLAITGIGRQIGGQIGAGGVDARFDIARCGFDIAVQVELQGHVGVAQGTGRGHLRDPGDMAELSFQGSGDRRGHDLRAGSGQAGRTEIVGKSTWGSGETGSTLKAMPPAMASAAVSSVVATGRRIKGAEMFTLHPPAGDGDHRPRQTSLACGRSAATDCRRRCR